tara:strand:- start:4608 stop:5108 length:501 start_codon:yes stop_codon:yes gene_type:complete
LISGGLLNPLIDPFQLSFQTPGITGEVKVLKPLTQLSACFRRWVKPFHCAATDGCVTTTAKPLHDVGSGELEALSVLARRSGVSHSEQLSKLGVQPGLAGLRNPRGETNPEGSMAAVGEMTWSLGLIQRANLTKRYQAPLPLKRYGTVIPAGIQRDEQHRLRVDHL